METILWDCPITSLLAMTAGKMNKRDRQLFYKKVKKK
jgi:hypothetical protein